MEIMNQLEPKEVFRFFEEICKIPHGSENTEQISNYLVAFAKERNLEHYQDDLGNVIIIKPATEGYAEHEPVMLQGHMDMVAVKEPDCELNLYKDGLRLQTQDDWIWASGTSLGGDDGIAVAYGLALLDGNSYKHPRIELVITVGEEIGMDGARALDVSHLKAKRLINLDSEEEGIFTVGCAGGVSVDIQYDYESTTRRGIPCQIVIGGLQGGHSGSEIHKERGNAICILGRILSKLRCKMDVCIINMKGGVADNAIPFFANAYILVTGYENQNGKQIFGQDGFSMQECVTLLTHIIERQNFALREELAGKDSGIEVLVESAQVEEVITMSEEASEKVISLINSIPHGIQAMSADIQGLVETSLNPGVLEMKNQTVSIHTSVRSSVNSAKDAVVQQLQSIASLAGASVQISGEYPGWVYRKSSPLRDIMKTVYCQLYQKEPVVEAIHAGLECGLLADKIAGLDCVSIGPNMENIHTTKERLSVSSTQRVWNYLLKLLEVL